MNIKRRSLRNIGDGTTIGIIGRRASGKTVIIKTIAYYMKPRVRIPIVFSSTSNLTGSWDNIIPPLAVFNEYKKEKLEAFLTLQASNRDVNSRSTASRMIGKKKIGLVIMDDIVSNAQKYKNHAGFIQMFLEGRHFDINNILSVQDALSIPSAIRSNIDYVIITAETRKPRVKTIFEQFWPSEFGSFDEFKTILEKTTEGHKCLFIDIKASIKANATFSTCVFWCQGIDPKNFPKARLGIKSFWKLNNMLYDSAWYVRKYQRNVATPPDSTKITLNG